MPKYIIIAHMPNGEIKEVEEFGDLQGASKKLKEYKDNNDDQRIWYVIRKITE